MTPVITHPAKPDSNTFPTSCSELYFFRREPLYWYMTNNGVSDEPSRRGAAEANSLDTTAPPNVCRTAQSVFPVYAVRLETLERALNPKAPELPGLEATLRVYAIFDHAHPRGRLHRARHWIRMLRPCNVKRAYDTSLVSASAPCRMPAHRAGKQWLWQMPHRLCSQDRRAQARSTSTPIITS